MRAPSPGLSIQRLMAPKRFVGYPEPGYFRLRLVRKGPWVPAIIWRPCPLILPDILDATPALEQWCEPTERSRPLRAKLADQDHSPFDVWERGVPIDLAEYLWRLALRDWAIEQRTPQPEQRPKRPADLTRTPSLF